MEEKRCYGCMNIKSDEPVCSHCGYDETCQNEVHQLQTGTVLKEQYMIGKVLGQGGFGITYLGWDMYLDIPVAIKEYFPNRTVMRDVSVSTNVVSYSGDAGVRFRNNKERFMREAKMLARFSQVPEIVQVKNFFLANNTAYIVMEYVEGINLKQVVQDHGGKLTFDRVIEILKPVMRALGKVHRAGLVHRDISPDNIMILPDGTAKLLDFGAVRDVGEADVNSPLSQSTEAILKQGYAPIEQYQNRGSLGPWTDVYALCGTIYYCLTGEVPTDAPGRLLDEEEISFDGLGLSEEAVQALTKGMAMRANDRINSMDELLTCLGEECLKDGTEALKGIGSADKTENVGIEKITGDEEDRKNQIKKTSMWGLLAIGILLMIMIRVQYINSLEGKESGGKIENTDDGQDGKPMKEEYTGICGGNIMYSFDPNSQILTLNGTGEMYDYNGRWQEHEDNQDGAPLNPDREFAPWDSFRDEIFAVYIGDGITSIGDNAFENVSNLQEVRIGNDVKRIGDQAFLSTSIRELVLPEGFTEIRGASFNYCEKLEKVVLPESLKVLPHFAFNECKSLTTMIVGDETELEEGAIHCERHEDKACMKQVTLYVKPGSIAEKTAKEQGYNCKEKIAGKCGEHMSWYLEQEEGCLYVLGYGESGHFGVAEEELSEWIENNSHIPAEWIRTSLPEWITYETQIKKLVVGPYVTNLNQSLFNELSRLKAVDLGRVQSLANTFAGCISLEELIIPKTVKYIGANVVFGCENLRKVFFLSEDLVMEGNGTFAHTPNLEQVYFSKGMIIEKGEDPSLDLFDTNYGSVVSPNVTFYVYKGSQPEEYLKEFNYNYEYR